MTIAQIIGRVQLGQLCCVTPVAVSESDSADDPAGAFCGLRVNVSGNVTFSDKDGTSRTVYMLAGVDYPYPAKRVFDTGTDSGLGVHGLVPV